MQLAQLARVEEAYVGLALIAQSIAIGHERKGSRIRTQSGSRQLSTCLAR